MRTEEQNKELAQNLIGGVMLAILILPWFNGYFLDLIQTHNGMFWSLYVIGIIFFSITPFPFGQKIVNYFRKKKD